MYKLAIFDLDGTLLNTLDDLAAACNYALRECGGFPEHAVEKYRYFVGDGPINLLTRALPEHARNADNISKMRALFSEYYAEHSADLTGPYDGITDMLRALKDAGVQVAVLSNKPHENVGILCDVYFKDLISMPVGFRDGVEPKPNPELGLTIMEQLGLSAKETVYVGDSGVDMRTGKNLGAYTIGVSWGYRTKDELESDGADVIIDEVDELVKIIVDK